MSNSHSDDQIVRITVCGHYAVTDAALLDAVKPELQCATYRFAPGGRLGHQYAELTDEQFVVENDRLGFPAGRVEPVRERLSRLGYQVEINDRTRYGHLRGRDRQLRKEPDLRPDERRFVVALSKSPRGQVQYNSPSEVAPGIALMSRLFPNSNFLAVVRNQSERDRLAAQIAEHTERPVTTNARDAFHDRPRLLVVTLELFRNIGGDDFDIVVIADMASALSEATDDLVRRLPEATAYAFVDAHRALHERERFHLELVFGPVVLAPKEETAGLDVTVLFCAVDRTKRHQTQMRRGLARKNRCYWGNTVWKQAVSQAAEALLKCGVPEWIPDRPARWDEPHITILAESSKQGNGLKRLLPGWELWTWDRRFTGRSIGTGQKMVTFAYGAVCGIGTDVVIRADGGPGCPLGSTIPIRTQAPDNRVLLVDFIDVRDELACADTRSRYQAYERQGWKILSTKSVADLR